MKRILISISFLFSLALAFTLNSCGNDNRTSSYAAVTGRMGEVYVIIDRPFWDGEIGDTLRSFLTQPYPMLPQDEVTFKLSTIPYSNFSAAFQRHRNLIIVDVLPEETETKIGVRNNVWATPQLVLTVKGPDVESIALHLSENRERIKEFIEQAERNRQTHNCIKYEDPTLRTAAEDRFKIRIFIPQGFELISNKDQFLWYVNRTNYVDMGLFIYTYPFVSDSTFTVKYLVEKRNQLLKQFVPGARDSSWMITNPIVNPFLEMRTFKGDTYGEMRGLWEVENDYMGGPFISRSYVDNDNRRIVTVEGYVYAPKYDKRDYVRRLEGILNSFTLTIPQTDAADTIQYNK